MPDPFPAIRFTGELRPSQVDVAEIARRELAAGQRRLHVVAPPGSGKTVTGLYLWAECIRVPALVLSPNSAIQAQWAARLDLFDCPGGAGSIASTDPESPRLFTSLTYQAVTLPRRGGEDIDADAVDLWIDKLIEKGQAKDPDEAKVWIEDLKRHNRAYYDDRLSGYRKVVRDEVAIGGEAIKTLHASALRTLERLKQAGVGLLILDECHHLMSHWGRVLADAYRFFDQPIVLGLTATPPDRRGKPPEDVKRYDEFFGPVDYEVPVPAIVKDGFLAPYQDLVQFVRPTPEELAFVANADEQLRDLVEELCSEPNLTRDDAQPGPFVVPPLGGNSDPLEGGTTNIGVPGVEGVGWAESSSPTNSSRKTLVGLEDSAHPTPFLCNADPPEGGTTNTGVAGVESSSPQPGKTTLALNAGGSTTRPQPPEANDAYEGDRCAESLTMWLARVLTERRLPVGIAPDWTAFESRDPGLAWAGPRFLQHRGIPLPKGVPEPPADDRIVPGERREAARSAANLPPMAVIVPVLDRYIRHRLRLSSDPADHQRAEQAIRRLRLLGTQVTETGSQACASPIGRVMAYARGKATAIVPILKAEHRALGDRIRAVVVTDFEKTSAVSTETSHLLDEEAGGAIAVYRVLLADPETDALDPVLVTGSTVLVDDDLSERFDAAAVAWLAERRLDVELDFGREAGFHVVAGHGGDWCPRVYVEMITELFQRGLTKCLVGTRGLLGEGWDASKINVLIDLTSVTTSTSVNQLRGRSFRLDSDDPAKLADNWDVVCVAPEFVKGLDDYYRFIDKHNTLFGLTDDGAIEKGVGHVHAAFTEIEPELVEESMHLLNAEMLERPMRRAEFRKLWRIGEPYHPDPVHALELPPGGGGLMGFPPFAAAEAAWTTASLTQAIGQAVLGSLREARVIQPSGDLHIGQRSGGYVRAFLENAAEPDSKLFSESLEESLGPLDRPRYVVPRYVYHREDTWLSRILPEVLGRYFLRDRRQMEMLHAVPSALAKNKDLVAIYQRHWNAYVSPGVAIFAQRGEGEELVNRARRAGTVPQGQYHRKEVFL